MVVFFGLGSLEVRRFELAHILRSSRMGVDGCVRVWFARVSAPPGLEVLQINECIKGCARGARGASSRFGGNGQNRIGRVLRMARGCTGPR